MALEVRGISKSFGPVHANREVDLSVAPGTLHAVLGENGAGKSTLMKILSGFQGADAGTVQLGGREMPLGSPRAAIEAGIGMLHQDPLVALPFTVADNFVFGRPDGMGRAEARSTIEELSRRLGFALDPDRVTRTLSVGERQQLEIVRLLSLGVRVLILDEPTSGITTDQRVALFDALRTLAADGLIVLFVSHKLEEVEALCSRVTVMQRGAVTGEVTFPVPAERLVEMMFGKLVTIDDRPPVAPGAPVVEVAGLSARSGRQTISEVAFELREGEVLGLAGLEGSGQLPLLRALAGLDKPTAGIVRLAGEDLAHRSHRHHLRRGVYFLPAGRLEEGLFRGLTISEHLALDDGGGAGDSESDVLRAVEAIDRLRIKGTPDTVVEDLSGGNQQRLLLAMLPERLRLLLMEQPTRGLDIESADLIWSRILLRRNEGTAIVFASADLDELVRYSDRLAVCFDGGVLAMEDAAGLSADRLGTLMGGRYR